MADNNFRSYSRDNRARVEAPRDNASDPLAELARLIGQGDPYAEHGSRQSRDDAAAAPGFDWAANQDYAEAHVEEHDGPPPVPPASYAAYARDEQDYEAEAPAGGQYFAGPAAKFNGFGEDGERLGPVLPPRQFPAFMSPAPAERYETEAPDRAQEAGEDYGDYADDYYEEPPRPRQRGGLGRHDGGARAGDRRDRRRVRLSRDVRHRGISRVFRRSSKPAWPRTRLCRATARPRRTILRHPTPRGRPARINSSPARSSLSAWSRLKLAPASLRLFRSAVDKCRRWHQRRLPRRRWIPLHRRPARHQRLRHRTPLRQRLRR